MNIVHYEPWKLMGRLHREIDQLFGDSFANPATDGDPSATWNSQQGTVQMIKKMEGVSDTDKEKILGGNAAKFYGVAR